MAFTKYCENIIIDFAGRHQNPCNADKIRLVYTPLQTKSTWQSYRMIKYFNEKKKNFKKFQSNNVNRILLQIHNYIDA